MHHVGSEGNRNPGGRNSQCKDPEAVRAHLFGDSKRPMRLGGGSELGGSGKVGSQIWGWIREGLAGQ